MTGEPDEQPPVDGHYVVLIANGDDDALTSDCSPRWPQLLQLQPQNGAHDWRQIVGSQAKADAGGGGGGGVRGL